MMEDQTTRPTNGLEQMLHSAVFSEHPIALQAFAGNTKNLWERYDLLKTHLGSKHDEVEAGALLTSAKSGVPYDSLVYLNHHGKGHVELVMNRAAALIDRCEEIQKPSGFELFLLLCAIQLHDIGNIHGRENHTMSFKNEFFGIAQSCFITEPGLKEMIFQISCVHGGAINGNYDTIIHLHSKVKLLNHDVNPRFLAAMLRFADELADDYSRAKVIDKIPEESKIFHAYSETLHSVCIEKNLNDSAHHILLHYFLTRDAAVHLYSRKRKQSLEEISLIEEILDRTEKVERERRYCFRFLIPHLVLTGVKVEIDVQFPDEISPRNHNYTLSDSGYPNEKIDNPNRREIIREITGDGDAAV